MSDATILAFDIGIKNLAWCSMKKTGTQYTILGWQNYNLLSGSEVAVAATPLCSSCSAKANYVHDGKKTCVRHCPPGFPALRDLSGNLLKTLPPLKAMRELCTGTVSSKAKGLEALATKWSLPIPKEKVKKAIATELTILHDAIRAFVMANKALFHKSTAILLENQPVLKNPTMKSVQILLFATLRDTLQPSPPALALVHAGKKVQGAATGDAGYKARKDGSEAKVRELLEKTVDSARWKEFFEGNAKKNDLADAFCMCVDRLNI
jgi:hypothetical protein